VANIYMLALFIPILTLLLLVRLYLAWNLFIILVVLLMLHRQQTSELGRQLEPDFEEGLRREAVAVAIGVALAQKRKQAASGYYNLPPTAIVSAWQAVLRSQVINKKVAWK